MDRGATPNNVYAAFYARRIRGDTSPPDRNTDIYISKSLTRAESFLAADVVQLTDELLGIPPGTISDVGPDQVMPSIVVDACGGVNVVFYDTRNPDNLPTPLIPGAVWVDVYYIRILNFGLPSQTIFLRRLTPASFLVSSQMVGGAGPGLGFLGDYHHMAVAGPRPTVYTAYIATQPDASGVWKLMNCFLHKISLICVSDLNQSDTADPDDVARFLDALSARDETADLNQDGVFDLHDEALFWNAFVHQSSGREPPPWSRRATATR